MIVLDTNVVSELMRPQPSPEVVAWIRSASANDLATTAVTLAEVRYGIERLPDGRRRDSLTRIAHEVFTAFPGQVLPFDAAAAEEYALVVSERDGSGLPIAGFDAQIASICRARGAALATRNTADFVGTGIDLLDPFRRNHE